MANLKTDIQTDAVGVADDIRTNHNVEDTTIDMRHFVKERTENRETVIDTQPETAHGDDIEKFIPILPSHLKSDCTEILILSSEADYDNANILKEHIEQNVRFCKEALTPRVILFDEVIAEEHNRLDHAFSRTVYILIYVTKEFCEHSWSVYQGHACLKKALNSKENEQQTVIPVHTLPTKSRNYTLPMMLDGLRPLNYFSKTFNQEVKKLLEHKTHLILERRIALDEERKKYIKENDLSLSIKFESTYLKQSESSMTTCSKSQHISSAAAQGRHITDYSHDRSSQMNQQQQLNLNSDSNEQTSYKQQSESEVCFTKYFESLSLNESDVVADCNGYDHSLWEEAQQPQNLSASNKISTETSNSNAVEAPTVSFSSFPQSDGDKAMPLDFSSYTHNIQETLSGSQVSSNTSYSGSQAPTNTNYNVSHTLSDTSYGGSQAPTNTRYDGSQALSNYTGSQAPSNYTGIQAPSNYTGSQAPSNYSGSQAPSNYTGSQAPSNYTGSQAPSNYTGIQAPSNYTGIQAPSNYTGSQAPSNYSGSQAPSNYTGSQAPSNYTGSQAPSNYTGSQAPSNYTGSQAPSNYTGSQALYNYTGSQTPSKYTGCQALSNTSYTGNQTPSDSRYSGSEAPYNTSHSDSQAPYNASYNDTQAKCQTVELGTFSSREISEASSHLRSHSGIYQETQTAHDIAYDGPSVSVSNTPKVMSSSLADVQMNIMSSSLTGVRMNNMSSSVAEVQMNNMSSSVAEVQMNSMSSSVAEVQMNSMSSSVAEVQLSNLSRNRLPTVDMLQGENASSTSSPVYHININATNVVIGEHGRICIVSSKDKNQVSDEIDDTDDEI